MSRAHTDAPEIEGLYKDLLNAIPMSVLLVTRDLRIALVNQHFLEKSRRTIEETFGRRLQEVFQPAILDHTEVVQQIQSVFEANKPTQGRKISFRAPGGVMRIYYYQVLPLTVRDNEEFAILIMEDVTEQTHLSEAIDRMERHLAIVVENTGEIILSTDPEGRILSWNKSAEQISGYTSEEVKSRFLYEFCGKEHEAEVRQVLVERKEAIAPRATAWNLVKKDGGVISIAWTCSPMLDERAIPIRIVAVGRDLTESRKIEAQLLQAQKLAALGVMAGGIAHELRNPLAICSSAAQFLMEEEIEPKFRRECAQKVSQGMQRASTIIEHLLKFARPSVRNGFTRVDLISVVKEALGLIADQSQVQLIELSVQFPGIPAFTLGDADLLQLVFMNLFLNAIHAMPNGGRLTVNVGMNHHEITVRVSDTGHGIPAADLDDIFDPFFSSSTEKTGTGLGLPLCYAVVKQHAGGIGVESVPGQGSTFTIRLNLLEDGPPRRGDES
jgi:PAS domain S-box-containing protein